MKIDIPKEKLEIASDAFVCSKLAKDFNKYAKEKKLNKEINQRSVWNMLAGNIRMDFHLWEFIRDDVERLESEIKKLGFS